MNKPQTPKNRIQLEVDAIAACADCLADLSTDVATFALEYLLGRYRSQLETAKSVVVDDKTLSEHNSPPNGKYKRPVRTPPVVKSRVRKEKDWNDRNPKAQSERRTLVLNYVRSYGMIDAKAASKVLKRDERAAQYVLVALARTGHLVRKGNIFVLA